jgi:hypothetical protein
MPPPIAVSRRTTRKSLMREAMGRRDQRMTFWSAR